MIGIYFDHRARLSAASLVFFSPDLPDHVMRKWGEEVDEEQGEPGWGGVAVVKTKRVDGLTFLSSLTLYLTKPLF